MISKLIWGNISECFTFFSLIYSTISALINHFVHFVDLLILLLYQVYQVYKIAILLKVAFFALFGSKFPFET